MNFKFVSPIAVAILAIFGVVGCGGGGSSTGPITVTVSPLNPSVAVGQMQTFTANVVGGTTPATVAWSVVGAGTIDANTGVYTAPMAVPATNDVVTATSQNATGSAIVNVTASQALQIAPGGPVIPAGMMQKFTATAGGNPVGSVTWQVNGITGGDCVAPANNATAPCHGTIDNSGNYVAPLSPPAGGVSILASSGTDSGTTTPTIQYSNASLTSNGTTGQYAIQYSGSDLSNGLPMDIAGSILTSGSATAASGTITGGEIDINSGSFGVSVSSPVTGGTFTVNPADGRASVTVLVNTTTSPSIASFTLQLVLTNNLHGLLIDFDQFGTGSDATGSGTIDAQNLNSFAGSLAGNYAFSYSGIDPNFNPLFAAGAFTANGGSISNPTPTAPTATEDVVDAAGFNPSAQVLANDVTLSGSYTSSGFVDSFGRGQIQLTSTNLAGLIPSLGAINFAYYMVDQTHANIVGIDSGLTAPLLDGQIFSAPTAATPLTSGVAFTAGGASSSGNPYVIGGVFGVTGTTLSNGLLDINTSGKSQVGTAISGGTYTNSTAASNFPGRFTLSMTTSKGTVEFAAYTTTINTALLVQIDTNTAGSTGTAYQQSSPPTTLAGSFATNLTGVGASKTLGPFEQDVSGQVVFGSNSGAPVVSSGTLDVNCPLTSCPVTLPINAAGSTFTAPTNNRGTTVLKTANGPFSLTYYVVSPTTELYIDTDPNRVAVGVFLDQF